MNDLQNMQLDILREFSRVAQAEGVTWFAMFGTLLGASRHGGFIPWDGDIDVAMPRAEYDRLRAKPEVFTEPYFLQTTGNDPGATPRYMRLMRNDTAYITNFPNGYTRGGHMGIYIDIIPLDIVPDIVAAQRIQGAAAKIHLQMLSSAAFDESGGEEMSDFKEHFCYYHAGLPGHYGFFAECYEKMCSSFSSGPYYAMPVLHGERGFRVYDREWFASCLEMEFEGLKISVPVGWKEALIVSYPEGLYEREMRYRSLAPEPECLIDTRRSYQEYTRRYTDALVDIDGKKVFIFGAGDSLRIWLDRYGAGLNIICAFDNDKSKWGTTAYCVPVHSPTELPGLLDENSRLIIASIHHKEIGEQLEHMNIIDYFIFIDGWNYRKGLS